jgi:hypothetical protein
VGPKGRPRSSKSKSKNEDKALKMLNSDAAREKDASKNQAMETFTSPGISPAAKPGFDLSIIVCNPIEQMKSPRFLSGDIGF